MWLEKLFAMRIEPPSKLPELLGRLLIFINCGSKVKIPYPLGRPKKSVGSFFYQKISMVRYALKCSLFFSDLSLITSFVFFIKNTHATLEN